MLGHVIDRSCLPLVFSSTFSFVWSCVRPLLFVASHQFDCPLCLVVCSTTVVCRGFDFSVMWLTIALLVVSSTNFYYALTCVRPYLFVVGLVRLLLLHVSRCI